MNVLLPDSDCDLRMDPQNVWGFAMLNVLSLALPAYSHSQPSPSLALPPQHQHHPPPAPQLITFHLTPPPPRLPGHGPGAPHRAEEGGAGVPLLHRELHRGEGVCVGGVLRERERKYLCGFWW